MKADEKSRIMKCMEPMDRLAREKCAVDTSLTSSSRNRDWSSTKRDRRMYVTASFQLLQHAARTLQTRIPVIRKASMPLSMRLKAQWRVGLQ